MSNLVALSQTTAPNPIAVEALEGFLAAAESGELRAVAIAGVLKGGNTRTAYVAGEVSIFEIIGAIECLRHRFVTRNIEV